MAEKARHSRGYVITSARRQLECLLPDTRERRVYLGHVRVERELAFARAIPLATPDWRSLLGGTAVWRIAGMRAESYMERSRTAAVGIVPQSASHEPRLTVAETEYKPIHPRDGMTDTVRHTEAVFRTDDASGLTFNLLEIDERDSEGPWIRVGTRPFNREGSVASTYQFLAENGLHSLPERNDVRGAAVLLGRCIDTVQ